MLIRTARKDDYMLLTKFFSSEGMDLLPDAYIFKLPDFIYLFSCIIILFILMRFLNTNNPKVNKIVIISSIILLLGLKYGGEAVFIYEWYHFPVPVFIIFPPFFDFARLFLSKSVESITYCYHW